MSHAPIQVQIPEQHKKEGLYYAFAPNGIELPIIDVGNPSFRVDPSEVETLLAKAVDDLRSQAAMPAFVQALLSRLMPHFSILAREIAAARGGFLSGLGTYLMKLGPDMLGEGYASALDRKIAGTIMGLNAALRLGQTAILLADSLASRLGKDASLPLVLVNIAGGPAADSLNALMILRRGCPALLEKRKLFIYVLDSDAEGPAFGEACLDALMAEGAPLAGLDIAMSHVAYDWNEASKLADLLRDSPSSIVAASSEGGLFEYGSDEAIEANFHAFDSRPEIAIVGSLSRQDGAAGSLNGASGASIRSWGKGCAAFDGLLSKAGWRVTEWRESPLSRIVALGRL